ncbi:MAG TPA: ABC transporter permease [Kofleriaceae bacterium]|nr:ABC transporter permease [Kofleriaceae bacterium]
MSGGDWFHRRVVIGAVMVGTLVLIAVIGPRFTADPVALNIDRGLTELGAPLPPSGDALLGTDQLGRDVWARIVDGAGTSLGIAAVATLIALAIGLAVGLAAGYAGGRIDGALMRLVDLVLAFPVLLLAILLAALLRESRLAGSSIPIVATIAVVGWTTMARVLRDKARVLARGEMVLAARAAGAGASRIIVRHLLPNVLGLVAVLTALGFAQNLLAESVLSYLGLGPPPPAPTWGRMLFEGRMYYRTAPHLVLAPGLAILIAVGAFHLLASGLRAQLDPRAGRGAGPGTGEAPR